MLRSSTRNAARGEATPTRGDRQGRYGGETVQIAQSLAPPLSGALARLPYAHDGASENQTFFRSLFASLCTHPEIGTTLLPAPSNQVRKSIPGPGHFLVK